MTKNSTSFKKGHKGYKAWLGKHLSEEHKEKLKASHIGKPSWNKGKKLSKEYREKLSLAKKGKPRYFQRGENSVLWKGGVTPINELIRKSLEYKLWREAVFERDNWTCIWCLQRGGKLEADHIKPFALFPELRFAIDNGRTLCHDCHIKTETWGGKTR